VFAFVVCRVPSGTPGRGLQQTHPDGHPHTRPEEDLAILRHEVVERELGVQAVESGPRGREAFVPMPLRRSEDHS